MNRATEVSLEDEERQTQYRLSTLQVYNWGTFSGLYVVKIPEKGFLILGKSGSGKSTLLDAHTALLTPPRWVDFNVAARENASNQPDRSYASYVRGAYSQRTTGAGEYAYEYLRTGTTWSAVAETYCNAEGKVVALASIMWIRGSGVANRDVKRLYLVLERDFNLRELEFFSKSDFDVRQLRTKLPDAHIRDEFSAYQERFQAALGIDSVQALRLLHKTQSTKNLEDLNKFLRGFMLDEPETFGHAERLVEEFSELNAAHASVVAARLQIETLQPARSAFDDRSLASNERAIAIETRAGIEAYAQDRREALLVEEAERLAIQMEVAKTDAEHATAEVRSREELLLNLEDRRRNEGGENIVRLERDIEQARQAREERERRRESVLGVCRQLEETSPLDPASFATLQQKAKKTLDSSPDEATRRENARHELKVTHEKTQTRFEEIRREVAAMERHKSNMDAHLLGARGAIADALKIAESRLPFAGELIQVREDAREWRGAIERVLSSFARSVLVDDQQDYRSFSDHVDATDLGARIVYLRMVPKARIDQPLAANSLIRKLEIANCPQREWLLSELRSRFDYTCTLSLEEFRRSDRAVTKRGQVRHNQIRHEKNDRYPVNDSRRWVLGFDNSAKRKLFEDEAGDLAQQIESLAQKIRKAATEEQQLRERERLLSRLVDVTWSDIDVAEAALRVHQLDAQLKLERAARPQLERLEQEIAVARTSVSEARKTDQVRRAESLALEHEMEKTNKLLSDLRGLPKVALTPTQQTLLDKHFDDVGKAITLDSVATVARRVNDSLHDEEKKQQQRIAEFDHSMRTQFATFNRTWPAEAGGLDPVVESAADYFAKLERLIEDGLPAFEQRFLDLLRKQSDENLTRLSTSLVHERKAIQERLDLVNHSLRSCEFNPGTFLEIKSRDLALQEALAFHQELRNALSRTLDGDALDAEQRFSRLRLLVMRLASQESADRNWRAVVLDVRQHVEFVAHEFDRVSDREIEVYRGGTNKSGGQRLKLASTCLAAALRYQLAGDQRYLPQFSTVLLDEAFDRTDNDFTEAAMEIFRTFGFQMIIATPLKQVMTLEPFIAGATVVQIRDRKTSSLLPIEYDEQSRHLDMKTARKFAEEDE